MEDTSLCLPPRPLRLVLGVTEKLNVNVLSSKRNLKDDWSVGCVDEPFPNMVFFSTRAMFPALTHSLSPTRLPRLRGPQCCQLLPCSTSNDYVFFDLLTCDLLMHNL